MGTFGKSTFQLWAGIALMWGWVGTIVIIVIIALPIYESFDGIKSMFGITYEEKKEAAAAESIDDLLKKGGNNTPTEPDMSVSGGQVWKADEEAPATSAA